MKYLSMSGVLGPDHPDTLTTRNNIAQLTGQSGDPAAALHLSQDLLPDLVRVLGPEHPHTLTTRSGTTHWAEVLSASSQDAKSTPEPHDTADPEAHSTPEIL
jgi:hypothetical protein